MKYSLLLIVLFATVAMCAVTRANMPSTLLAAKQSSGGGNEDSTEVVSSVHGDLA